jgi:hypothetical protein
VLDTINTFRNTPPESILAVDVERAYKSLLFGAIYRKTAQLNNSKINGYYHNYIR